jgi:hypothetical protein
LTKKLHITIPKPCHENWEAMTPIEKGKFCSTCQKKVFDLTKASDKEIIEVLQNNNTACGRFTSSQLNRNLYTNQQKSSYWLMACATLFGFIGLGNHSSYAQVKNDTIKVDTKVKTTFIDSINPNLPHKIKGTVSDELGPLPGASVIVEGTTIGTYCDFDGNFEIDAKIGDTLEFTFVGKNKVTKKINKNEFLIIKLNENIVLIGEICITKKRTFFGRQIQKVKNWFR